MPSPLSPSKPIPGVTPGTPVTSTPPPKPITNKEDYLVDDKTGKVLINPETGKPIYKPGKDPNDPLVTGGGFLNDPLGIKKITNTLGNVYLWKRIGLVAIGVLLIWWAILIFLATNKKIGGAVTGAAKKVISKTPQGAAANVITGSVGL